MDEHRRGLRFSGSAVKSWFQYRCDRKTRYETLSPDERAAIPVLAPIQPNAWAQFGLEFERLVLRRMRRGGTSVYLPLNRQQTHDDRTTLPFLQGVRTEEYAYQLRFHTTPWLERELVLTPEIQIQNSFPDLVRLTRDGPTLIFELTDIKATHVATPFHKVQVAFYALMLQGMMHQLNVNWCISESGSIWRMKDDEDGQDGDFQEERFALASYTELVKDLFRRKVPALSDVKIGPGVDETFFHVYYKCEQCQYLEHCYQALSKPDPKDRDISAVPGLSHDSKRALWSAGVRTVGDLASSDNLLAVNRVESWSLQSKAEMLISRAKAIAEGVVTRRPKSISLHMPPHLDVALILLADFDPVGGDLVSLGYLCARGSERRELIEVLPSGKRVDEATAIKRVLGAALADLADVDRWNTAGGTPPRYAHIFVFEPAEAVYLREAIGRHLDDAEICTGLLNMIRIFPPDQAVPEPEFHGMHHLPASALRNIVEQLFALPVTASYDLRQVTEALANTHPALPEPYLPQSGLERRFSSMLPLEVTRALRRGDLSVESVEADVSQRLHSTASLIEWLVAENERADTPFLRLRKMPFRFQGEFNPLSATDLDILHAYALLENRSSLLQKIIALAQPAQLRRDTLRCFAGLRFDRHWRVGHKHCLELLIPPESRDAELSSESFALVLTQDDPDILLDPSRWGDFRAQIEEIRFHGNNAKLKLLMMHSNFERHIEPLLRSNPNGDWFLDEIFSDPNTDRLLHFLEFVDAPEAER